MNEKDYIREAMSDLWAMLMVVGLVMLVAWVLGEGLVKIATSLAQ